MKNKKSQQAMDFLVTYGWAILVVVIVIGALAYFGVLSPERFLPNKCLCSFVDMDLSIKVTVDGVDYLECFGTYEYVDFEEKRIKREPIRKLFYCDNRTLVPVE